MILISNEFGYIMEQKGKYVFFKKKTCFRKAFKKMLITHTMILAGLALTIKLFWQLNNQEYDLFSIMLNLSPWFFLPVAVWLDCVYHKNLILGINAKQKRFFDSPTCFVTHDYNLETQTANSKTNLFFEDLRFKKKYLLWESEDYKEIEKIKSKIISTLGSPQQKT